MFLDELKKRGVPSLKSRAEMLELLQREEYGCLPKETSYGRPSEAKGA